MLGAASIGAVFSSTSPDFGVDGVVDRFGQIEPTVLVATDGYHYGGKWFDCLDRLDEIRGRLPSCADRRSTDSGRMARAPYDGSATAVAVRALLPFDHPVVRPVLVGHHRRTEVHRAPRRRRAAEAPQRAPAALRHPGRRPRPVLHDHRLDDVELAGVGAGAAARRRSSTTARRRIRRRPRCSTSPTRSTSRCFGTSAQFIDALHKAGRAPRDTHALTSLRTITSTGSPLSPDGFRYVYDAIKPDVHLASISGGTDLCGCLVAGVPTQPVYAGEIQGPGLGMAHRRVRRRRAPAGSGRAGRARVHHAVPLDAARLLERPGRRAVPRAPTSSGSPGVWHQGDFASWTEHGGIVIHGRSDATLNPGGVRIGTAEISAQVDKVDGVVESLVIGQEWDGDTRVVCFVVLAAGSRARRTNWCRRSDSGSARGASPRHVPAKIIAVPDLPRTRSNKLSELAVRDVVHGRPVANTEALANPEALDAFRDLEELRS